MTESRAGSRIGVDVGGTFTDVVCVRDGRPPLVFKVPSTPANPGDAALAAVERLAAEGVEPGSLTQLAHGTTVATNAVLERRGGRLGIVTTEGFRDTLEIGRQMRREMYEVRLDPQTPVFLAPRAMRIGGEGTDRPGGRGHRAARRSVGARHPRPARRRRSRVHRGVPALLVRQPGARTPGAGDRARRTPGARDLALERGRPRVPRVRTDRGHRLRRVHQADGAALPPPSRGPAGGCRGAGPAPGDAVARGARERRHRPEPPGAPLSVRSGGRRHRRPGNRSRSRARRPHHPGRGRNELRHCARLRRQAPHPAARASSTGSRCGCRWWT